jgi:hypothetical protein
MPLKYEYGGDNASPVAAAPMRSGNGWSDRPQLHELMTEILVRRTKRIRFNVYDYFLIINPKRIG